MQQTRRHSLNDILTIAICAAICNCDDWVSVQKFGEAKLDWFKTFLQLPSGIPSHATFLRVFSLIDPREFSKLFTTWVEGLCGTTKDLIALDGKTIRRSLDRAAGKAAIHMVSAWSSRNRMALGQVKTESKSNEITAIPELLDGLFIKGAIVTIDAMGCQKKIAKKITDKGADYVLALKGNQGLFEAKVESAFLKKIQDDAVKSTASFQTEVSHGHGRTEVRRTWVSTDVGSIAAGKGWENFNSIGAVSLESTTKGKEPTREVRFFISSLRDGSAKALAAAVRAHWGIENSLHRTLDMAFREDECRIRNGHGAENFATLRHIALNLVGKEKSHKTTPASLRP